MTCPIDALDGFLTNHWDVDSLCSLMGCLECTAEPGEGAFWYMLYPPCESGSEPEPETDGYDIPF